MKRLWFFRHSKRGGPGDTLSAEGLALAAAVGAWIYGAEPNKFRPNKIFTGVLARTVQTALGFMRGYTNRGHDILGFPETMPAIFEFGTDELFAEMVAPDGFREKAKELGNYYALFELHDVDTLR